MLEKLTAAINYFTPGMPKYGAGQAVAVVKTILVGGVPAAIEANLKELVKHIGVVALFTSPHQRFAAKDRLLHLFDMAHKHHLGGFLSQVIHITRQYRNFGGGVGSVAEMETIGQVASLGIFFYLGAFTSYGIPNRLRSFYDELRTHFCVTQHAHIRWTSSSVPPPKQQVGRLWLASCALGERSDDRGPRGGAEYSRRRYGP